MAELVFNGHSEVSDIVNDGKMSSTEDRHNDCAVQDTGRNVVTEDVSCSDKTVVVVAAAAEEMPQVSVSEALLERNPGAVEINSTGEDPQALTEDKNCQGGNPETGQRQQSINGDRDVQQPELSLDRMKEEFGAFSQLNRPASVVIDLRSPPLVQVCLLHGADDVGAGGSGSTSIRRRPQTARRGRRQHSCQVDRKSGEGEFSGHRSNPASRTDNPSEQFVPDNADKSLHGEDDRSAAELSTIIHLKVVEAPDEKAMPRHSEHLPGTSNTTSASRFQMRSNVDSSPDSSDDSSMRVRNVNRTYARNRSIPSARKSPQLLSVTRAAGHHDGKRAPEIPLRHAPERKKSKTAGKQRTRIGPAWFSRRFLDAPPVEIWQCARTAKEFEMLKRPNYDSGVRRRPIVARPTTSQWQLKVPVDEEADVGREQLQLWRLSEDDVDELRTQLREEARHRRSEHIMPLVMQMTDAQIEHAYEHVAESMKTYEIVEADSDEDVVEDEEEEEGATADSYENDDWSFLDEVGGSGFGVTEYSRLRPKRHAVDYGPSAYAPIMIMEGRRLSSQPRKSSRESQAAGGAEFRSHSRKSQRHKRKKSRLNDQLDEVVVLDVPAEKSAEDTEDAATEQRVGLFDGLSHSHNDDGVKPSQHVDISLDPSLTLPLLIPAKHVAVISAVRSSPPPDLGLPMASGDVAAATDPDGPPVLERELDHDDSDCIVDEAPPDSESADRDHNSSLTSVPTVVCENGVVVIE